MSWKDLPASARCERLAPPQKQLQDTIKFVAYRAETAMVHLLPTNVARADDPRAHMRDLFHNHTDIYPDTQAEVLHVRIHAKVTNRFNAGAMEVLKKLNETESCFSGTKLRLANSLTGASE